LKKRLLIILVAICGLLSGYDIANAQEVTYGSNDYYWNPFETGSAASLNSISNYQNSTHSVIASNTITPLDGSYSAQSVNIAAATLGGIYGTLIPNNTDMTAANYEWSFLYKYSGSTSNIVDVSSVTSGKGGWRYWIFANSSTPTASSSTSQGVYFTQIAGNMQCYYKQGSTATSFNLNYAMTAGQTYNIIIKRLNNGGTYAIYIDNIATHASAQTFQLQSNPGTFCQYYNYSVLECNDARTGANFQWDDFKIYQPTESISAVSYTPTSTNVVAGQTNVIAYEYSITVRDAITLKVANGYGASNITNQTYSGNNTAYISASSLYEGPDNNFSDASLVSTSTIGTPQYGDICNSTASALSSSSESGTTFYYFILVNFQSPQPTGGSSTYSLTTPYVLYDNNNGGANVLTAAVAGPTFTIVNSYDWVGGNLTGSSYLWRTPANWKLGGSTSSTYPGQNASTDVANIGVNYTFTGTPTVDQTPPKSIGSIITGPTGGTVNIAVNTGITLTTGSITQNHTAGTSGYYGGFAMSLTGAGTITCTGNVAVGNTTAPASNSANLTNFSSQISQLTVDGNIVLNAVGNNSYGQNYPVFNLDNNKVTLVGQFVSTTTGSPTSSLYGSYNSNDPGIGKFSINNNTNTTTLELQNANPIQNFLTGITTDFDNGGGGTSTVIYDASSGSQTVYSYADYPYIGHSPDDYQNLTLSGGSTKVFDGTSVYVGQAFTSSGGAVNLYTNYPSLTVGTNWTNSTTTTQGSGDIIIGANVVNNSGGTLALGSGDLYIGGNYTNNAGGVYTQSTGTTTFDGGTQTLVDNSTAGTTFNNVVFDGTGTLTATINAGTGNFAVSPSGTLTMGTNSTLQAGSTSAAYLTLQSNATASATVNSIPTSASITNYVNVQRYISAGYRGYRLFSSPVNTNSITPGSSNVTNISYLGSNTYSSGEFIAGPGSGFGTNGTLSHTIANPTIYLYQESALPVNYSASFLSGKNIGITSIGSNTVTTTSTATGSTVVTSNVKIPAGNGYISYFIGPYNTTTYTSTTPATATTTAPGYLNQGNVTLYVWGTSPSSTLTYTTGTNARNPGYTMVGNPFPATLDLKALYNDTYGTSNNKKVINPSFYELNDQSQSYVTYNTGTGSSGTGNSEYVASGQGFFVSVVSGIGSVTNKTLTFTESDKASAGTFPSTLLLAAQPPSSQTNVSTGLHLRLSSDTVNYDECGLYFRSDWKDTYDEKNDSFDLDGANPKVFLSSYSSDNVRTSINALSDYTNGKRIKLFVKATTDGIYKLDLEDIFNIDTINYKVYLIDTKLNDSLDMVHYKSYTFNLYTADTADFAGRFMLSIEPKPLPPYQLITFTGQKAPSSGIQLDWKTINEGNFISFGLEKLGTNGLYSPIDSLQSNSSGAYTFDDQNPIIGNNIYRLAQADVHGKITFAGPININYNTIAVNGMFTIYPNPSKDIINIAVNSGVTGSQNTPVYQASIYDLSGVVMNSREVNTNNWTQDVSGYKAGVYILELKTTDGNIIGKAKFVKTN
jgi:trimeric autotransporter adhesin